MIQIKDIDFRYPGSKHHIEPHVLKALIMEDLRVHPLSKISDIAERIPDIDMKEIRKMLYSMVGKEIEKEGTRFDSKYYIK